MASSATDVERPKLFASSATDVVGLVILVVTLLGTAGGCARYQFGNASLYRTDIRTVYVPIVRSDSFRPELGVQLTELIQKRIEERTPFKIVGDPTADSILNVRLTSESKRVLTETRTDEPRNLETLIAVEASWADRRGNVLMENRYLPDGAGLLYFSQSASFVPEAGQSIATAQHRALDRLADHIVDQMESRW